MRMFHRGLIIMLMVVFAAGLWSLADAQAPKTLVVALQGDPTGLDPQTNLDNESWYIESSIYDSLVSYKLGSTVPAPGLAESWTISPDGKTYTFKLRSGVTFQDGTPVTAQAVAADLDRAVNPQNPCYVPGLKGVASFDSFTFGSVAAGTAAKIEAVDASTVRFTLPVPNAGFIASLAMVSSGIMSPAVTKQYGCDMANRPVGTGPFKFVEMAPSDHVTLAANPTYWRGRPKMDRVVFQIIPESTTRLLALERNQVQIVLDVLPSDYDRISGNKALQLMRAPALLTLGVGMAVDAAPFNDVRVRKAMNYAVDKDAINKGLYAGAATSSQAVSAPYWAYNPAVKPYPYDSDMAKKLLAEAGYPNGFTTDLLTYSSARSYNPAGGDKLAEAVQPYLAKVGVTVRIQQFEFGAYLDKIRHTPWQGMALFGGSGDNGDPDNMLSVRFDYNEASHAFAGSNYGRYHNPVVSQLFAQARSITDQARRAEMYKEINAITHDDAPWIFVNNLQLVRAARANVDGFVQFPVTGLWRLDLVSLK